MSGVIYLQTPGGLQAMQPRAYELEDVLQGLLAQDARLLGGASTGESATRRWILITRESTVYGAGGQVWSADHVFVDHEGVPTIVEVKRGSNTQIRREVVGQLLDYVSNLAMSTTAEAMRVAFEERVAAERIDPEAALQGQLGISVSADEYWALVAENLARGRIRGYFVADAIPEELRRIVEYLNRQLGESRFLALEVQQFQTDDATTTTLVPTLVAGSLEPPQAAGPRGPGDASSVHLEYWRSFADHLHERGIRVPIPRPGGKSLMYLRLGKDGLRLAAWNLVKGDSGVGLVMNGPGAVACLDALEQHQRAGIEDALRQCGPIQWVTRRSDQTEIIVERSFRPLADTSVWPEREAWMADALAAMYALFTPLVPNLDVHVKGASMARD